MAPLEVRTDRMDPVGARTVRRSVRITVRLSARMARQVVTIICSARSLRITAATRSAVRVVTAQSHIPHFTVRQVDPQEVPPVDRRAVPGVVRRVADFSTVV